MSSFNNMLEQYLFNAAAKFIDLADQRTQTDLIDLISRVNEYPVLVDADPKIAILQSPPETEWQQVLAKPINLKSVYTQKLIGVTRKRICQQEAYINCIEVAIRFTQHQGQVIEYKCFVDPLRCNELRRNEQILKQHQAHLATARITYKVLLDRLHRLSDKSLVISIV